MKMNKTIIGIAALLLCHGWTGAQTPSRTKYGPEYYGSPVNFAITMAGNVGEIRSDHFHSGIDIKALQGVGSPINAVADGYVSRISVSPTGYGLALYVTHPNGETSVYGHLDSFVPKIASWVRQQQYSRKSFAVDLYPAKEQFPVKKGERIASLGNSGSSGGPHLHLEIRDAAGNRPRNLISQGVYQVSDRLPPEVTRLLIYEVDTVAGDIPVHRLRHSVPLRKNALGILVPANDTILTLSKGGYAAYETIDYKDGRTNTMGVYAIRQKVDGEINFYFAIDYISFATTRYINTFTDYAENRKASRTTVLRAYLSPHNALTFYRTVKNRGILTPPAEGTSTIETEVVDDALNVSRVKFRLKWDAGAAAQAPPWGDPVRWNRDFRYTDSLMRVVIPQKALYESAIIPFGADSSGRVFTVGFADIPLQKTIQVAMRADVPRQLRSKALLVTVNGNGKVSGSAGGEWFTDPDGFSGVRADVRRFGTYTVAVDTVAPVIRPALASGNTVAEGKTLRFTVTDDLSGIGSYELKVDGQWALLTYDPKNRLMEHTPAARAKQPVNRQVELTVTDGRQNKRTFKATYKW